MSQVLPLPNMPIGTYYETRKGKLKFWRNLPMKFRWKKHLKEMASRKAYMYHPVAVEYMEKMADPKNWAPEDSLRYIDIIDGSHWLNVNYIKHFLTPDQFREMQCHVTTWIPDPDITDEMREQHRQEESEFEWMCGGYPE